MKRVYNIISIEDCQLGSVNGLIVKMNPVTFIYTGMRYLPKIVASESYETEYVIFKNQSYVMSYLMDMVEHCKRHDYLVLNLDSGIFDIQKTNINDRGVLKVKTIIYIAEILSLIVNFHLTILNKMWFLFLKVIIMKIETITILFLLLNLNLKEDMI